MFCICLFVEGEREQLEGERQKLKGGRRSWRGEGEAGGGETSWRGEGEAEEVPAVISLCSRCQGHHHVEREWDTDCLYGHCEKWEGAD